MKNSPQNPYESYIVEASAGTGKTYQLSRRFLYLVGAGAAPGNILTITFTVKAAGEMRARILEEATRLLCDLDFQTEFESSLKYFYEEAIKTVNYIGSRPRIPRTARETAREVLSSTQLLKISTIDSLFNQWVAKFPWESGIDDHGQNQMPTPYRIMDSLTKGDIDRFAWNDTFAKFDENTLNALDILDHYEKNVTGPFSVIRKLEQLDRQNSYLWKLRQEATAEVYHHPLPSETGPTVPEYEQDLIKLIQSSLVACAEATTNSDDILAAIAAQTLQALIDCKLITKSEFSVSKIKIKGKKRDALDSEIDLIESAIKRFINEAKLQSLNKAGLALYQIYVDWTQARETRKAADKIIEFGDLSKGAYRLFNRTDGVGATWLIQKTVRHLMIDEFQDTSLLQWSIFKKLSEELLSGQHNCDTDGIGSSVFIVGDAKQSIYGFREGDPIVLEKARSTFRDFEKREIPLDRSFRTAQIVLDFVNAYFGDSTIAGFRHHETAKLANGQPHVPNCGQILMRELFTAEADDSTKAVEKEASFLATTLKNALTNSESYPVYDKKTKKFRPLRAADCCILYRSSTNVGFFEDALRKVGLPCKKAEQKGFFDRQEIQDLVALLTYFARPADTLALITFLKSPMAMLSDQRVLEFVQKARETVDSNLLSAKLLAILKEEEPNIYDGLARTMVVANQQLPHELVIAVYREFDALHRYEDCFADAEGDLARSNLLKFVELCCDFEDQGFVNLQSCLNRMKKTAAKDEHGSALTENNAITLMTVHKSKGLEFPLVAIIEIGSDWFQVDQYWLKTDADDTGIAYIGAKESQPTDDRQFANVLATQTDQLRAEAQRLLYVAMTRSSHYLMITGNQPGNRGKESFFARLWSALLTIPQTNLIDSSLTVSTSNNFDCAPEAERRAPPHFSDYTTLAPIKSQIPLEIEIMQPSRHPETHHSPIRLRQPIASDPHGISPLLGNVLHRFFEETIRNGNPDYETIWHTDFIAKLATDAAAVLDLTTLQANTTTEFLANIASDEWHTLLKDVRRCTPEMEIVQLLPKQLVRGTIDLLIEYTDGSLKIVDYKSAQYTPPLTGVATNRQEDLIQFCRDRGYSRQLEQYGRGVRSLYPGARIDFGVWLTKERAWVPLGSA